MSQRYCLGLNPKGCKIDFMEGCFGQSFLSRRRKMDLITEVPGKCVNTEHRIYPNSHPSLSDKSSDIFALIQEFYHKVY